jgi:CRP-like cAMP-binding protein
VRTLEPSVICHLETRDLEELLRNNPEAGHKLARMLAERLVWMEARWADLAAKEVLARLASMLLLLAQGEGVVKPGGYRILPLHPSAATLSGPTGRP